MMYSARTALLLWLICRVGIAHDLSMGSFMNTYCEDMIISEFSSIRGRLFSAHENVIIIAQNMSNTLLTKTLKLLQQSHTATLMDFKMVFSEVLDQPMNIFLIIVGNVDAATDVLRNVIHAGRQHRQSVFIILLSACITSEESVQRLFYTAWDLKMFNVLVVWNEGNDMIRSSNMSAPVTNTHTYSPFLSLWTVNRPHIALVPFTTEDNLHKIHSQLDNLNGYPLVVSNTFLLTSSAVVVKDNTSIEYFGSAGKLFETLVEKMNFTAIHKYQHPRNVVGTKLPNGSWIGVISDLFDGRSNISCNEALLSIELYRDVDITDSLRFSVSVVVVPKAVLSPEWMNFIVVLQSECWILVFVTFFITMMFQSFLFETGNWILVTENVLMTWGTLLQVSVYKQPPNGLGRFVFIIFVLFSLIITSVYVAQVMKFLASPLREPNMNSLEEVSKSNLVIGTSLGQVLLMKHSTNPSVKKIYKALNVLRGLDAVKHMFRISKTRDAGFILPMTLAKYYADNVLIDRNGESLVHIVKQGVSTNISVFPLPKGSPFLRRIREIARRVVESGLIRKWVTDLTEVNEGSQSRRNRAESVIVTLEHLFPMFGVLSIGLTISTFVLITERILVKKVQF